MTTSPRARLLLNTMLWIGGLVLLGVVIAALSGWFGDRLPRGGERAAIARDAAPGRIVVATERIEPVRERFPATVRPAREALVAARIVAQVRDVAVRSGSVVAAGDPLLLLDDRDLVARVQQEREALASARAGRDEARPAFERVAELRQRDIAPQSDYDRAEAALRAADAAVTSAERRVEEAEVALSFASIVAPFDGIVVDRFVDPGDLASPGVPLLKLYDPARLRVEAHVRESLATALRVGHPVRVELGDRDAAQLDALVEEIVPQAEPGSRSVLVKASLPSVEGLYPGLFARLVLESGDVRRILVPEPTVRTVGQVHYVELAEPRGARRLVVPGAAAGEGWREILSGVAPGDRLLAAE